MMLSFLISNRDLAVIHRLYSIIFINNLVTCQAIINLSFEQDNLQQYMEAERQLKQVILCDLEKQIDLKILTHYLTTTKALECIKKITKIGQNFLLLFENRKEAQQYINKTSFKEKIIKRYINLYFSQLDESQSSFQAVQLLHIPNQMVRKCFQLCSSYGICKFAIKPDPQKKLNKIIVSYLKDFDRLSLQKIIKQFEVLQIKAQIIEEDSKNFKCSIELINFQKIQNVELSKEEMGSLKSSLQNLMKTMSPKLIKSIQIKSFLHNQNTPYVKAYIRYSTIEDTFEIFSILKKYILDSMPIMKCKIYFFQNESNSYRTLFTNGLQKQQEVSEIEFQNLLLGDFRKINQNVVQICLKWNPGNIYTGKIYLKDQESGKNMIGTYQTKRKYIFKHYKDNGKITINIFQDKKAMSEIRKLQKNTFKMFENFQNTRERNRQTIKAITPQHIPYYNESKGRQFKGYQRQKDRQRQKIQIYKRKQDPQKKFIKYKPKQEDFPSI